MIRERPPNVLIHGYNEATIRERIVEKMVRFSFSFKREHENGTKREDDDKRKLVILVKRSKFVQKPQASSRSDLLYEF